MPSGIRTREERRSFGLSRSRRGEATYTAIASALLSLSIYALQILHIIFPGVYGLDPPQLLHRAASRKTIKVTRELDLLSIYSTFII